MKRLILLAFAFVLSCGAYAQNGESKTIEKVTIQTNGVCQKCADLFNSQIPYFKGVKEYSYDVKTAKVTISYDKKKTTPDQLRVQISKLGYNADNVKADAAARAKLPACCRGEKSCGTQSQTMPKSQEHKCNHGKDTQHKCSHGQASEHKCGHSQGQKSCSHSCSKNMEKSATHKCPHSK